MNTQMSRTGMMLSIALGAAMVSGCAAETTEEEEAYQDAFAELEELGEEGDVAYASCQDEWLGFKNPTLHRCCYGAWSDWSEGPQILPHHDPAGNYTVGPVTCVLPGPFGDHTGTATEEQDNWVGHYDADACPNNCSDGFAKQFIRSENFCIDPSTGQSNSPVVTSSSTSARVHVCGVDEQAWFTRCQMKVCVPK